jgi:PncC family amidohydrolase
VLGGVIAYANGVKHDMLGVDEQSLATEGAVSEAVVREMADGARARLKSSVGLAITGVAGPGGGTPEKPVGTVWIAAALPDSTRAVQLRLIGDREEIRRRATQSTLELLRRTLLDHN